MRPLVRWDEKKSSLGINRETHSEPGISSRWKKSWRRKICEDFERNPQAVSSKTGSLSLLCLPAWHRPKTYPVKNCFQNTKRNVTDWPAWRPDFKICGVNWTSRSMPEDHKYEKPWWDLPKVEWLGIPQQINIILVKNTSNDCRLLSAKRINNL